MKWFLRILAILVAAFIVAGNSLQGDEGTIFGFYPLNSAQRIGFDLAKAGIDYIACWFVYRSFKTQTPKVKVEPSAK